MKAMITLLMILPLVSCSLLMKPTTKVAPTNTDRNSAVVYANLYSPVIPTNPTVLEKTHA